MPRVAGRAGPLPGTRETAPAATTASDCCRGGRHRVLRAGRAGTPGETMPRSRNRAAVSVIPEKLAQGAAEPIGQRHAEAHLRAVEKRRRQTVAHRIEQNPLALAAGDLPGVRDGGGQFGQLVIEQRAAHFERIRHRHAVHLDQHVAGQVGGGFEVHHLGETCRRRRAGCNWGGCAPGSRTRRAASNRGAAAWSACGKGA